MERDNWGGALGAYTLELLVSGAATVETRNAFERRGRKSTRPDSWDEVDDAEVGREWPAH